MLQKLNNLIENIIFIMYAALVLIGGAQVFNRFVLSKPLTWSQEVSKILFFYIIFLGAALALRKGSFVIVDFIYEKIPQKLRTIFDTIINFLIIAFLITIIYEGIKICIISKGQVTPALQMPQAVVYMVIPLGGLMMLIFTFELIFKGLKKQQ